MATNTSKAYSTFYIKENVIWVKHPSVVDKEVGTKLFKEIKASFPTKIDESKPIIFCYDCSEIKLNLINSDNDINGFKESIIDFHNSIQHLDCNISLIVSNTVVRVVAGAINIILRKKTNFFKSEELAKAYIKTVVPNF